MGAWFSLLVTSSSKIITLHGRKFIIQKQIGEGGFAFVYLVEDPHKSRKYAVKKVISQTEEHTKSCNTEIEIFTKFKHPNLLKLLDYEIKPSSVRPDAKDYLFLMPLYTKGTLEDIMLRKRGKEHVPIFNTEKEILKAFYDLLTGMKLFHSNQPPLAHNDIKPGNILISDDNRLVLFDFGSVHSARFLFTSRREALAHQEWCDSHCTPLFKAPELFDIASDAVIDERTDVWALGCVLYGMAFNESPFEHEAATGSVALAVGSGKLDFPHGHKFSEEFCQLIKWMMTLDPHSRPFVDDVIAKIGSVVSPDDVSVDIH